VALVARKFLILLNLLLLFLLLLLLLFLLLLLRCIIYSHGLNELFGHTRK